VWSSQYSNWNITDPSLVAGSTFPVQVNVTNAPAFNGYEFALYFDQSYIDISSYDLKAGLFNNPYSVIEFTGNGSLRLSIVNLGPPITAGSGILVSIIFKVVKAGGVSPLVLAAPTTNPSPFAQAPDALCKNCRQGTPNWTRLVAPNYVVFDVTTSDGYFNNVPLSSTHRAGPASSFTFIPTNPVQGNIVTFDGSSSFDPDNLSAANHGILRYLWDFGDRSSLPYVITDSPTVTHYFAPGGSASLNSTYFLGNFSIRLTVIDFDSGFQGMRTVLLTISPPLVPVVHDISVLLTISTGSQAFLGQNVSLIVLVTNNGTTTETYGLTVIYHLAGSLQNVTLANLTGQTIPSHRQRVFLFGLNTTGLAVGTYLIVAMVSDPLDTNPYRHSSVAQLSIVLPDEPPTASFTFTPQTPVVGQDVLFNGNSSRDPDGSITRWNWNFGDGFVVFNFFPFTDHIYNVAGNYSVTLTVFDTSGLSASAIMIVHVLPRPQHDVALAFVQAYPPVAFAGQRITLSAGIVNTGSDSSTVDVTFYYNGKVAGLQKGLLVPVGPYPIYANVQWDTTGIPPGNYNISAIVFLPGDPTPADNSLAGGSLQLLPPPVITLTPASGPVGTLVVVHGSGFSPNATGQFFPVELEMTFDNQLVGLFFPPGSSFDFSFDVPDAQVGSHTVHAVSLFPSNLDVQAVFTVTPTPTGVSVSLSVGSIYFPGDTATIFVLSTVNGQASSVGSLQVILIPPTGSNITLNMVLVSPGFYKATYAVPSTAIGTYAVIAKAHLTGSGDGSALAIFEVKPTWLSAQGPNLAAGLALTGLVGVAAMTWRKGYFRRKEEQTFAGP
jgi:PKD repeat protein